MVVDRVVPELLGDMKLIDGGAFSFTLSFSKVFVDLRSLSFELLKLILSYRLELVSLRIELRELIPRRSVASLWLLVTDALDRL